MQGEKEKLRILLNHWVQHNREHAQEFRHWAEKAGEWGQGTVSEDILRAAQQMDKGNESLLKALERLKEG